MKKIIKFLIIISQSIMFLAFGCTDDDSSMSKDYSNNIELSKGNLGNQFENVLRLSIFITNTSDKNIYIVVDYDIYKSNNMYFGSRQTETIEAKANSKTHYKEDFNFTYFWGERYEVRNAKFKIIKTN